MENDALVDLEAIGNKMKEDAELLIRAGRDLSALSRFQYIHSTIVVNAMHTLGCTREEAEAYANGTSKKTFIQAIADHVEAQRKRPVLPLVGAHGAEVKTINEWKAFATRDDCLDHMVPSDLRVILSNFSTNNTE